MLQGKHAIVTGGASGIGRATAILLAEEGALVVVGDYSPLAENADEFKRLGIQAINEDVRKEADCRKLVELSGARVDILVNSAGVTLVKQVPDVEDEEWSRVFDINLKGVFLMCKHAIPRMQSDGGCIVNVSSNAGLLPRYSRVFYARTTVWSSYFFIYLIHLF